METTTWDEASRCPKCKNPMKTQNKSKAINGEGHVYVLECANRVCLWFEETKLVQRLPNGEVPIRETREKEFPALTEGAKARARASIEQNQLLLEGKTKEMRWS